MSSQHYISPLDVNVLLLPPYYREIFDYKNADNESIEKAVSNFDWPKEFRNKNANENCKLLTGTLMNISRNIPLKSKKLDYNTHEWMNILIIFAKREHFQKIEKKVMWYQYTK